MNFSNTNHEHKNVINMSKKVILSITIIAAIGLASCKDVEKNESTNTEQTTTKDIVITKATFGVRGNCGMCKSTIEKAANTVDGLETVAWDGAKKQVSVSFDSNKTTVDAIHKAIANSGYDTDKFSGNVESYNNLPGCCQYDHEMAMNQSGEVKYDNHLNNDH